MSETKSTARAENWIEGIKSGKQNSNILRVLKYIKDNPKCSITNMINDCQMHQPTLTGVVSKLQDEGVIKIVGTIKNNGGYSYSQYVFVGDMSEVYRLKHQRLKEKMHDWAVYGMKHFYPVLTDSVKNALIDISKSNTIDNVDPSGESEFEEEI